MTVAFIKCPTLTVTGFSSDHPSASLTTSS